MFDAELSEKKLSNSRVTAGYSTISIKYFQVEFLKNIAINKKANAYGNN